MNSAQARRTALAGRVLANGCGGHQGFLTVIPFDGGNFNLFRKWGSTEYPTRTSRIGKAYVMRLPFTGGTLWSLCRQCTRIGPDEFSGVAYIPRRGGVHCRYILDAWRNEFRLMVLRLS